MSNKNTINELMDADPLNLTPENIDQIIAFHRQARSGPKPTKEKGPKITIDLEALGLVKPKPVAEIKRRV